LAHHVADGGREVERRDAERGARLDDAPRLERAAEQVAELRLVAVECDQLVAQEAVDVGVEAIAVERTLARPTREVVGQSAGLRLAAPVQAVEQDLELRIAQDRHGRLVRPPRAAARKGRGLTASTRRCAGLQRELSDSRRRYAFDAAARQRRGRV